MNLDKSRYEKSLEIAKLIRSTCKNKNIKFVEIGVYDGLNAKAISDLLPEYKMHYIGFDFFEDAVHIDMSKTNPGVHSILQSDPEFTMQMHQQTIQQLLQPRYLSVKLIKGNTKDTLPLSDEKNFADVYYIDGAHTYEGVKNDYECIENYTSAGCLVIFDDVHIREIDSYVNTLEKKGKKINAVLSMKYFVV